MAKKALALCSIGPAVVRSICADESDGLYETTRRGGDKDLETLQSCLDPPMAARPSNNHFLRLLRED